MTEAGAVVMSLATLDAAVVFGATLDAALVCWQSVLDRSVIMDATLG
ncbi:MAG TPA: hypothetical protein VFB15_06920 [Candidatus Binataceae bacterium]|jgi:hypothetical protein|nr:hypothetical protein [Candidatus Binataceae bacterium]